MRVTLRCGGENVGLGDLVVVAYTHEGGPIIGLIGQVERVVMFDAMTGESVMPVISVRDFRSKDVVEISRDTVIKISQIDGPYLTEPEVGELLGEDGISSDLSSLIDMAVQLTAEIDELSERPIPGASELAARMHDITEELHRMRKIESRR